MIKKYTLICVLTLVLVPFLVANVNAQPNPSDYAPIFYFEGGETCYPVDAQYHLDNSVEDCLDSLSESTCYYDNIQGTIDDNGIIQHYQSVMDSYGYTVYYRVDTSGTADVIQYWMFYAFNGGDLNQHEGDWEMVEIVFDSSDQPLWVAYSQHHSGQSATWSQVEKDGNHMKVYVARGSHANYLRSYSGKLGVASDVVGANGKVLTYDDYDLNNIEVESWIDYEGRWGWVPDTESAALEASILGQAGPEGPMFREGGSMWNDPISWGNSLFPANDMLFTLEWFMYNFVMIFLLITLAIVGLMVYKIYNRHKKYGLGPRIVSMLYINGLNLHSIGNILCIVSIVLAFIGLVNPWYAVSYSASGTGITDTFQTDGANILSLDGMSGLQVTLPGTTGPVPMGTFDLPFSLFLAVGLILMIISTIGVSLSKKLGTKYLFRGIRLIVPFILVFILVAAIGSIIPSFAGGDVATNYIQGIVGAISASPFGGQTTVSLADSGVTAQVSVQWGLGLGLWLLLIAAIIFIVAGVLMIMSKTQFFATKVPLPDKPLPAGRQPPMQPPVTPPMVQPPPPVSEEKPKKGAKKGKAKSKDIFCHECGTKLDGKSEFCVKCGKKLEK